jgi:recombination protein RecT
VSEPTKTRTVDTVLTTISSPAMRDKIKQALPPSVDIDRFTRTTLTAIQQTPELLECDSMSLYNAVVRAAQDGLLPDGREGIISPYRVNTGTRESPTWSKKAQWMPMAYGIIKRLGKAGIYIDTQIVCANDTFEEVMGDDAKIVHKKPPLGQDRGKMVGVYAIATLPDGQKLREVMDMEDIARIQAASKSGESDASPWGKWKDEMARKSVLRRLSKRCPIPDESLEELARRLNDDEVDPPPPTPAAQQQQAPTVPAQTNAARIITQQPSEPLVGDIMPKAEPEKVPVGHASSAGQDAAKDVF